MSEFREMALRSIGRNVVNFQKIEGMLKLLLANSNFNGPISKLQETLETREKDVDKKSLGRLANEYFQSFGKSMERLHAYPDSRDEPWISFSFVIENQEGYLPQQKTAISALVYERNRLIHQMLVKFQPDSEESCKALISELDKQNELIKREYSNLQETLKVVLKARRELLSDFLNHPLRFE